MRLPAASSSSRGPCVRALLIVTGVWNLFVVHPGDQSSAYLTTLLVKLLLVAVSGIAAALHIVYACAEIRARWVRSRVSACWPRFAATFVA